MVIDTEHLIDIYDMDKKQSEQVVPETSEKCDIDLEVKSCVDNQSSFGDDLMNQLYALQNGFNFIEQQFM